MARKRQSSEEIVDFQVLDMIEDGFENDSTAKAMSRSDLGKILKATCSMMGLQLVWSTIFSNGSSYLFALGVSSSSSAFIWAAAPICGAFVQPLVASLSDRSQSHYGKRRPFIVVGTVMTIVAMFALAWVENVLQMFGALFGFNPSTTFLKIAVVFFVWILNIAIQPLQFGLRALVVDVFPEEQQVHATAYASRFMGFGNILGHLFGAMPMPWNSNPDERSRFRFLCLLASIALVATAWITCHNVSEEDANQVDVAPQRGLRQIVASMQIVPRGVLRVFYVQFSAWFGWFGFLYYSSTLVGEVYQKDHPTLRDPDLVSRVGSAANLMFALVSFLTSIVAPMLYLRQSRPADKTHASRQSYRLIRVWASGHLLFAAAMCSIGLFRSVLMNTFLIAIVGISWAFTLWIPFAVFNSEISSQIRRDEMELIAGAAKMSSRSTKEYAGAMVALHNTAISVPQILASLLSGLIFKLNEHEGRLESIVWVMRASGLAGLWAAYTALR